MRVLSNFELQRLSRSELLVIQRMIASELPLLAENSAELRAAHFGILGRHLPYLIAESIKDADSIQRVGDARIAASAP